MQIENVPSLREESVIYAGGMEYFERGVSVLSQILKGGLDFVAGFPWGSKFCLKKYFQFFIKYFQMALNELLKDGTIWPTPYNSIIYII